MTAVVKVHAIAEFAGISVIPHGGGNTPCGQQACFAMPATPWTECFVATPPGVPPEESARLAGMATPKDSKMVPSDGPGFGVEVTEEHVTPFEY